MTDNGSRPAFPIAPISEATFPVSGGSIGLTKREALAGLAMMGLLAAEDYDRQSSAREIARMSVNQADALLAELAKLEAGEKK